MPDAFCKGCGEVIVEKTNDPVGERKPCPKCGSLNREYHVKIEEKIIAINGIGLKAHHGPKGQPYLESYDGPDLQHKTGKLVHKVRIIDRENDKYLETVQDYNKTDQNIHRCEGPLSKHTGHGNAKLKKKSNYENTSHT